MTNLQGLVGARKKEIQTEEHLKKIAEREEGRLEQEVQRLQREMEELKERKNIYEVNATIKNHNNRYRQLKCKLATAPQQLS